ncbi:MAG: helix-turn-helix transcriptional regulator [Oscillospiraceae bacterium]|nr:helix-turn-helix transcriptional regulator [Oscillospiraceae bacterium]MBQ3049080.1 helix-turn-helix transcriptional regulator [Oscillospiraceae bacterium]MBQ9938896.1 helix-turn-helix transcriptional regulator [Oscillospiraceae bacterium]
MEDMKLIFASNLINLRTKANMTQLDLAEKINYSDKSVSKWERGEAVPDVSVIKTMADIFGVTVDYMITSHDSWKSQDEQREEANKRHRERHFSAGMVTLVAILGIWTLALLLFVIFWMLDYTIYIIFLTAIPATLITLLVLNCVWNDDKRYNVWIVMALVLSLFLIAFLVFFRYSPWKLLLVLVPAELIVYFSFKIKKGFKCFRKNK